MNAGAIPLFHPRVSTAARDRTLAVLDSGWLGYGPQCLALERVFTGERGGWALATSSCTTALYLAALLCRDRYDHDRTHAADGDRPEVIVPAMTFISSAMAFAHAGYRVRVADVDRASLTLTAETAERMLTPQTRAIVVVHLYGQYAPDIAGLRALADHHRIALIEDCAHRIDLADTSRAGDFACFSFNAVKELPGGEGGLLWARDAALEQPARALSNSGLEVDTLQRTATTQHRDYGFSGATGLKLRSNDIAAALVLGALDEWPERRETRRRQFVHYDALLRSLAPAVVPMVRRADDSFLMYVVRTTERTRLRECLAARRIATSVHYPSLARHPLFARDADPAARADALDAPIVTLPTSPGLTAADQEAVTAAIADALAGRRGIANAAD
jgi:dTDP-4-amino-4,6-dideoxygalactose transaminase